MRAFALALLVVASGIAAARWGSWVAGGSDSYCYVYQAERWAQAPARLLRGQPALQEPDPLALEAPWPDATRAFVPAGHLPSPTIPGAIVPICPAGLSIVMAPVVAVGGPRAAFLVLPLFAALLVLATYRVGSRFGARIGLASALVVACSPVVLYQAIQPMNDVAAAALWTIAVAAATGTGRHLARSAGFATGAAILVRPNLLPLGAIIGLYLLCRPERTWSDRLRTAAVYAAWCAPACLAVAWIQYAFYGSPFASGYGLLSALFALDHAGPNLRRYLAWLWQTHTPAIVLAALAPFVLPGALTLLFAALIVVNLALYLPYVVFDDWSFLRFLLPTVPLVLILTIAVIDAIWRRARLPYPAAATAVASMALAALFVREAIERQTFGLQRLESRFERAGLFVADRLPDTAWVVTSWHSGSVRFYAGRKTLVWDGLDPASLDAALAWMRSRGYEPYFLVESWEEQAFRERFAGSTYGALDWPPMAEVASQVRIYRPEDRERYRTNTLPPTEYVR